MHAGVVSFLLSCYDGEVVASSVAWGPHACRSGNKQPNLFLTYYPHAIWDGIAGSGSSLSGMELKPFSAYITSKTYMCLLNWASPSRNDEEQIELLGSHQSAGYELTLNL